MFAFENHKAVIVSGVFNIRNETDKIQKSVLNLIYSYYISFSLCLKTILWNHILRKYELTCRKMSVNKTKCVEVSYIPTDKPENTYCFCNKCQYVKLYFKLKTGLNQNMNPLQYLCETSICHYVQIIIIFYKIANSMKQLYFTLIHIQI